MKILLTPTNTDYDQGGNYFVLLLHYQKQQQQKNIPQTLTENCTSLLPLLNLLKSLIWLLPCYTTIKVALQGVLVACSVIVILVIIHNFFSNNILQGLPETQKLCYLSPHLTFFSILTPTFIKLAFLFLLTRDPLTFIRKILGKTLILW